MANQVGFDPNAIFLPGGMNSGFLLGGAMQGAGVQPDLAPQMASQNHVAHSSAGSFVQASPQLPLSQAQCEQFLNFLKCHMATGSGNDAQTGHQAATVMTSYPSIPHIYLPHHLLLLLHQIFQVIPFGFHLIFLILSLLLK